MELQIRNICPNCFSYGYKDGLCKCCGYQARLDAHAGSRTLQAGAVLQYRYCVGKVLGEGGFGIIYKVYDIRKNEICAVKEYAPSGQYRRAADRRTMEPVSLGTKVSYAAGLNRFLEEARILMDLQSDSSVVDTWESFQENNTAYFVMEYLDGVDLGQIIRGGERRLTVEEITKIILQAALCLDVVHTRSKIIHRDISPNNLYLTRDNKVKVIDFGSAKRLVRDREDVTAQVRLRFSPPEQYSSNAVQGSFTDVYALAATYYYALTGMDLPSAKDRLKGQSYVPLKQLGLGIGENVSDAVDQALLLDAKTRTQTMQDFIRGIVAAIREGTTRAVPYVSVLKGPLAGRSWTITSGRKIRVGRSASDADLRIEQPMDISRLHCEITYLPDNKLLTVRDISTYGVFYNGQRLERGREYSFLPPVRFLLASEACMIEVGVRYEYH